MSPQKRSSPRKNQVGSRNKNVQSPRRPAGTAGWKKSSKAKCKFILKIKPRLCVYLLLVSPAKSSSKSPLKNPMVSNSFYGKQKAVYLTPLERKAIKELLPSPPPLPPPPPSQEKKKRSVKGGKKRAKAGTRKPGKMGIRCYTTSAKTVKQATANSRFDYLLHLYNTFLYELSSRVGGFYFFYFSSLCWFT